MSLGSVRLSELCGHKQKFMPNFLNVCLFWDTGVELGFDWWRPNWGMNAELVYGGVIGVPMQNWGMEAELEYGGIIGVPRQDWGMEAELGYGGLNSTTS